MKYILFLLLILGFIGCRKEEIDPYVGKMYAKLNNSFGLIRMETIALNSGSDSITIHCTIAEKKEASGWVVQFYKVPKKVGRFSFPAFGHYLPAITTDEWLNECATGRMYLLPETKSTNYIEITSYNPETGDIEGRFEFTAFGVFRNERYEIAFDLQDSMSFTNGEFSTRIRP